MKKIFIECLHAIFKYIWSSSVSFKFAANLKDTDNKTLQKLANKLADFEKDFKDLSDSDRLALCFQLYERSFLKDSQMAIIYKKLSEMVESKL